MSLTGIYAGRRFGKEPFVLIWVQSHPAVFRTLLNICGIVRCPSDLSNAESSPVHYPLMVGWSTMSAFAFFGFPSPSTHDPLSQLRITAAIAVPTFVKSPGSRYAQTRQQSMNTPPGIARPEGRFCCLHLFGVSRNIV